MTRYDTNPRDGEIDKGEMLAGIDDYLFGTGAEALTKEKVLDLIDLYLFG